MGYVLGSQFAVLCTKQRAVHFRALLKAKDPWIRVAGAVYLSFEDAKEGLGELLHLSALDGDAGVWAALARARRGDASAVPRMLQVFATAAEGGMAGVGHSNLQKRVMVLLSNSAKASGIDPKWPEWPQTELLDEEALKDLSVRCTQWWETNKAKVRLSDPWMPILAKQRVD
jgi:hypothetical protein